MAVSRHRANCLGRWKALIFTCWLTFPLVQVVPCSGPVHGLKSLKPSRRECWQVSSEGRCRRRDGSITWGTLHPSGYREVSIGGRHFSRHFKVHRLIALAFLGPPPNDTAWQVNHLDGNKSNNQVSNLDWATSSQNNQHSHDSLPRRKSTHRSKPVVVNGARFPSIAEAAQNLALSQSTVSYRCHRNTFVDGCEYRFAEPTCGDHPGEQWKPMISMKAGTAVPGRMVSSLGRIKSQAGVISLGHRRKDGYCRTSVTISGQTHTERVHRLVVYTFLGPPPTAEHTQVNHKDMNPSNNSLANLEYMTPSQNNLHKHANREGTPSYNCKPVLGRAHGSQDEWRRFSSGKEAADTLGLDQGSVSRCVRGVVRQTGGYEFEYADPEAILPGEEWRDVDEEAHLRDRELRGHKR